MRGVWREFVELWRVLVLGAFIAGLLLSPNVAAAVKMADLATQGAYAEIQLQQVPPERYATEIAAALDVGDTALARSLAALAASRAIAVPPELTERIATLPALDIGATLGAGWNCVVNGDFDSEAGFACVVATDLTGIGDVRDLVGEGGKFIAGQPVDYFTLGIASVGLGLTAATLSSLGSAAPLRIGASFVKAMHRVGKLPPRLTAQIATALQRGINRPALNEAITLATSMRLGELGRPLSRLFNPRSVRLVSDLAKDFGTIGKAGGVRAMKLSIETADTASDVRRLARVANTYGDGYVGVIKLVGRGVLRLGQLLFTIVGWLVGAMLWVWSMLTFILNAISGTDRFFRRRARKRRVAPAMQMSNTGMSQTTIRPVPGRAGHAARRQGWSRPRWSVTLMCLLEIPRRSRQLGPVPERNRNASYHKGRPVHRYRLPLVPGRFRAPRPGDRGSARRRDGRGGEPSVLP